MANSTPPDSWRMPLVDVDADKRLLLYANAAIWRWELTVDDDGIVSGGLGYPHTTMQTNAEAAQDEVKQRVEECVGVPVRLRWSRMEPAAVASLADERQKRIDEAWTAEVEPEPSEATRLHDEIRSRRNRREESVRDAFVGKRIEAIQYLGYERVQGNSFWLAGPTHLAEHGVAFRTVGGGEFSVAWDSELGHHGLAIVPGLDAGVVAEIRDHGIDPGDEVGVVRADVTGSSEWSNLLGIPVDDASVLWVAGIPSTIRLKFSNGDQVFLTAGEYDRDRDSVYMPDDNVTVVFGDEDARRLEVPGIQRE